MVEEKVVALELKLEAFEVKATGLPNGEETTSGVAALKRQLWSLADEVNLEITALQRGCGAHDGDAIAGADARASAGADVGMGAHAGDGNWSGCGGCDGYGFDGNYAWRSRLEVKLEAQDRMLETIQQRALAGAEDAKAWAPVSARGSSYLGALEE